MKFMLLARYFLQQRAGIIVQYSSIFQTAPWGNTKQSNYLNQAIVLKTYKTPFQLLKLTQKIEKELGRKNKYQNAERIIDIDLLFIDDIQINAKNLTVPHPRLHLRNFTMEPLLEINQTYIHPVFKKTLEDLAKDCVDTGKVSIFDRTK